MEDSLMIKVVCEGRHFVKTLSINYGDKVLYSGKNNRNKRNSRNSALLKFLNKPILLAIYKAAENGELYLKNIKTVEINGDTSMNLTYSSELQEIIDGIKSEIIYDNIYLDFMDEILDEDESNFEEMEDFDTPDWLVARPIERKAEPDFWWY